MGDPPRHPLMPPSRPQSCLRRIHEALRHYCALLDSNVFAELRGPADSPMAALQGALAQLTSLVQVRGALRPGVHQPLGWGNWGPRGAAGGVGNNPPAAARSPCWPPPGLGATKRPVPSPKACAWLGVGVGVLPPGPGPSVTPLSFRPAERQLRRGAGNPTAAEPALGTAPNPAPDPPPALLLLGRDGAGLCPQRGHPLS